MRLTYAIVYVSSMQRSTAYYRDTLGLPLRFESPGWTEFATEGATLALQALPDLPAATGEPVLKAGICVPGIRVADLEAFHKRACERNVTCVRPPEVVFGYRIANYAGPDGEIFAVSEERRA